MLREIDFYNLQYFDCLKCHTLEYYDVLGLITYFVENVYRRVLEIVQWYRNLAP